MTRAEARSPLLTGVFRDGGRPVGLCTAKLHWAAGVVDVDHIASGALSGLALPGGIPGPLHPDGHPDPATLGAGVRAFEAALRKELGWRARAVAYRQVYDRDLQVMARGTTLAREGSPVAVLDTRVATYDDYLRRLKSSRRAEQRRLRRRIDEDPGLKVYQGPVAGAGIDREELFRLINGTSKRNRVWSFPLPRIPSRRRVLAMLDLPGVEVVTYTGQDGRLVGASLAHDHPVAPAMGAWGALPLGPDRRSGLWFDHHGRQIQRFIERGRPVLIGGKGHVPAKTTLGFTAVPQWTVLRRLRG